MLSIHRSRLQYDLEHRGHAHYLRRLLAKGLGRLHTHTHRLHTQRHMGSRGRLAYHTKACTQAVGQWLNVVREVTLRSRQHIYAAVSLYRIYRYLAAYTAWRGYAQHQKDKRMRMYEARAVRRSLVVRDVCSRVMRYAAHIHPDTIRRRYLAKKYTTIWRHLAGKRAKQAARQRPVTRPSSGSSIVADSRVGVSGGRDRSMDDEKEHVRIYSKAPPRLTGFLEVIERAEQLYCNDEKDTEESLSDIPAPSHSLPPIVQHYVDVAEAKVDLARAPPKQSLLVLGAEADKQDNLEVLLAVGGDAKETKRQLRKQLAHEILKFVYEYKDVLIMEA
ncbi:hypothetical protein EON65_31390 [archaeon]|nr:MAG: hypothetical protein EON65_31390 [archaeon]